VISFEYSISEESVEQFMLLCKLCLIIDYYSWKFELSDSFSGSRLSGFKNNHPNEWDSDYRPQTSIHMFHIEYVIVYTVENT